MLQLLAFRTLPVRGESGSTQAVPSPGLSVPPQGKRPGVLDELQVSQRAAALRIGKGGLVSEIASARMRPPRPPVGPLPPHSLPPSLPVQGGMSPREGQPDRRSGAPCGGVPLHLIQGRRG